MSQRNGVQRFLAKHGYFYSNLFKKYLLLTYFV
ncbi:hypothetical protein FIC_00026 [Flavobacteriaceae bacterium 3519-10]|nr:hypothetical protein FIC_00026 [Flavobacteriaceae bacterium 3519-10]